MRYKFKRTPYAHQKDAIRKLTSTGFGGALLMAPRTGKTKTLIDYACIMHEAGHVNRVLITCPVAVMGVWEEELAVNIPERIKYSVTVWDKDSRKDTKLPKLGSDRLDFVIINHDAFSTAGEIAKFKVAYKWEDKNGNEWNRVFAFRMGRDRKLHVLNDWGLPPARIESIAKMKKHDIERSKTRGGRFEMKKAFLLWQPQLLAIDESHRFKSSASAKHRVLLSITWNRTTGEPRIPYRVLMTGTAVTKKKRIFDIHAQWRLLNPRRFHDMTLEDFKYHYARWIDKGNYKMWVGNRPREVEELRAQIHLDSFAITRDECFDLPHMSHQLVPVELEGETARVYDEMAEQMIAQLKSGEITEATIKLVQTMRLAQISSGVARTPDEYDYLTGESKKGKLIRIGTEKMDTLESILFDLFEADEKVVVAARFTHDIRAVEAICNKLKVKCFTMEGRRKGPNQSRTARTASLKQFKTMDEPGCYIVQPQSGSMGIDLSAASTLIWYSLTPSWVDFTQMNDRIALNPHAVSIMFLIASPVDQLLYDTLQEDGDIAKAVTDSPDRLSRNYKATSKG